MDVCVSTGVQLIYSNRTFRVTLCFSFPLTPGLVLKQRNKLTRNWSVSLIQWMVKNFKSLTCRNVQKIALHKINFVWILLHSSLRVIFAERNLYNYVTWFICAGVISQTDTSMLCLSWTHPRRHQPGGGVGFATDGFITAARAFTYKHKSSFKT